MTCAHESFCHTDDLLYVMCEGCEKLFDAIELAAHTSERLANAKQRIATLEHRLTECCVDRFRDSTWCQLCRTEHRWPNNDADKRLHLHAVGCVLDRRSHG